MIDSKYNPFIFTKSLESDKIVLDYVNDRNLVKAKTDSETPQTPEGNPNDKEGLVPIKVPVHRKNGSTFFSTRWMNPTDVIEEEKEQPPIEKRSPEAKMEGQGKKKPTDTMKALNKLIENYGNKITGNDISNLSADEKADLAAYLALKGQKIRQNENNENVLNASLAMAIKNFLKKKNKIAEDSDGNQNKVIVPYTNAEKARMIKNPQNLLDNVNKIVKDMGYNPTDNPTTKSADDVVVDCISPSPKYALVVIGRLYSDFKEVSGRISDELEKHGFKINNNMFKYALVLDTRDMWKA